MIDVFMFCDLHLTRLSARGVALGDQILPLVHALHRVPTDSILELDLGELTTDANADALLGDALRTRAAAA